MRRTGLKAIVLAAGLACASMTGVAASNVARCYDAEGWNGAGWYRCGDAYRIGFGWLGEGVAPGAVFGGGTLLATAARGAVGVRSAGGASLIVSERAQRRASPNSASRPSGRSSDARTYSSGRDLERRVGRFSPPAF